MQNQSDKLASKTFQEDHLKSGGESETKKNNSKAESSSNLNKQATYVKNMILNLKINIRIKAIKMLNKINLKQRKIMQLQLVIKQKIKLII